MTVDTAKELLVRIREFDIVDDNGPTSELASLLVDHLLSICVHPTRATNKLALFYLYMELGLRWKAEEMLDCVLKDFPPLSLADALSVLNKDQFETMKTVHATKTARDAKLAKRI